MIGATYSTFILLTILRPPRSRGDQLGPEAQGLGLNQGEDYLPAALEPVDPSALVLPRSAAAGLYIGHVHTIIHDFPSLPCDMIVT